MLTSLYLGFYGLPFCAVTATFSLFSVFRLFNLTPHLATLDGGTEGRRRLRRIAAAHHVRLMRTALKSEGLHRISYYRACFTPAYRHVHRRWRREARCGMEQAPCRLYPRGRMPCTSVLAKCSLVRRYLVVPVCGHSCRRRRSRRRLASLRRYWFISERSLHVFTM